MSSEPAFKTSDAGAGEVTNGTGRFHRVEAQEVVLSSPDGGTKLTMTVRNEVGGLWIERGPNDPMVAIWNSSLVGTAVGVYGKERGQCAACIGVDKNGESILQMVTPKGKTITLTADDIEKIMAIVNSAK